MSQPKKDFANKYRRLVRAFAEMTVRERKVALELLQDEVENEVVLSEEG